VKRLGSRSLSLILLLCFVLVATACNAADLSAVTVSGRVVIEGSGQPLVNHEVELWTLKLPSMPVGMGGFVKKTTVRTDANGLFSLSAEVPKDQRFELRTSNPGTVFGGGAVSLKPASSIADVTIVHKMPVGPKNAQPKG
jgi:hypothetical protein